METDVRALLSLNPILMLFLIIGIGYLVGYMSFFSAFLADGRRYVLLALVVTALSLVLVLSRLADFEFGLGAGLLAGALTSTRGFGNERPVRGRTAETPPIIRACGVGYAGTYTFANVFLTFAGTLLVSL